MSAMAALSEEGGTREKIMDAAEDLFIEKGYSATSLRAIATAAGVNLAATNYHFGSKFGLLTAVFHRRIKPIDDERLAALDRLEDEEADPTVRQIMTAFLSPILRADNDPVLLDKLPRLAGRIMGEPETLTKPLLEGEFTEVAGRYQAALARALPQLALADLRWRFHFMIGGMIQLMRLPTPLGQPPSDDSLRQGMHALIDFAVAGFAQEARP